ESSPWSAVLPQEILSDREIRALNLVVRWPFVHQSKIHDLCSRQLVATQHSGHKVEKERSRQAITRTVESDLIRSGLDRQLPFSGEHLPNFTLSDAPADLLNESDRLCIREERIARHCGAYEA